MLNAQSKKIRENGTRALHALLRGDFEKALKYATEALRAKAGTTLRTPERIEAEGKLTEFCRDLSASPQIIDFLELIKIRKKPFVDYRPGTEEQIAVRLEILLNRMAEIPDWADRIRNKSPQSDSNGISDDTKAIRADIARAKNYLKRNEFTKSLERAVAVFNAVTSATKLKKSEKFEISCYMEEYCRDVSNHPQIIAFLESIKIRKRPYVEHTPGKEHESAVRLSVLADRMTQVEAQTARRAEQQRLKSRDKYLFDARAALEAGEYPRARAYLRRVAEEHIEEPEVVVRAGRMLLEAGLPADAADILSPCRKKNPGHEALMQVLVQAYRAENNFEKAEELYMEALSRFGAHPQTLLNMAGMYRDWHKMDKAYEFAVQALALDPDLEEAREITDRMDKRTDRRMAG